MKNFVHRVAGLAFGAALVITLPLAARAQGLTDRQEQQNNPNTTDPTNVQPEDAKPAAAPIIASPLDSQIHPAGKAGPWAGSASSLRFGPFALASMDVIGVYDQFYPSGDPQVQDTRLSVLRANIQFAKVFNKNLFVLQYLPELAMLNGQVHGGADGNNSISIGQTFNLSPRFSLTLKNDFGITHTRQMFPDQFLVVERQNGGVVQAYFLENPGNHLQDAFTTFFNFKWTPRLSLTVAPGYIYSDTHTLQVPYI